ncbi:MAG: zinc-dependent metalloprotease [Planctomycetota bacterium]|nr:zinc-dependent metalloprotease [Planctomycetota bacterium]
MQIPSLRAHRLQSLLLTFTLVWGSSSLLLADETKPAATTPATVQATPGGAATAAAGGSSKSEDKPKYPPHSVVLKDAEPIKGLIPLYLNESTLYAELNSSHLNRDFIVLISIAKGIGQMPLYGGMSWGFGDDWVWQFRKVDDTIRIVRRNVRFKATKGSPEDKAVGLAYTDSVLFSLPILTTGPNGGSVVDLSSVFMSDLPQISQALPGFMFSSNKSNIQKVNGYEDNIELQIAATYASSGLLELDSVADSRGATINVHYSISALPDTGYRPRLADDRVGYFLTVLKDYSQKSDEDQFVRYINRWDLVKADPSLELSPPKKPIVFWIEKTVPFKYRAAIRSGIMEWNKAFEKAGFVNAIEVHQQPDNADWNPEDINYNTFRWITSSAGFAMGPSRVNPLTGQILDADIIFDADFIQAWKSNYETFSPESIAALTGGPLDLKSYKSMLHKRHLDPTAAHCLDCQLSSGRAMDLAFGSSVMMAKDDGSKSAAEQEKLIMQGLKEVVMHEVGHTLGLRHNFKSSTLYSLEELNDVEKTSKTGLTASVMDYSPANIAPKGTKQGDYFSTTIGPYDMWAIEYGYKPIAAGSTEGEESELKKIASRSGEPGLAYTTDEDTRGIDPDPLSNRFDMGKDTVAYAKQRAEVISALWPKILDRMVKDGDGYQQARRTFGVLLKQYGMAMFHASRNVGGIYVSRSHKGDAGAKAPFIVVDPKQQREALALMDQLVFSDAPFQFPPNLYNHLAATRWSHWGTDPVLRPDYAVHETIAMWQERILQQLLSPLTLQRIYDSELKVPADQDAFTSAELIRSLTKSIFGETEKLQGGDYTERKPAISSLRRNLQRSYLQQLSQLAMGETSAPADCQSVALAELKDLQERINKLTAGNVKLDTYTKAHLAESSSRIGKVVEAKLNLSQP